MIEKHPEAILCRPAEQRFNRRSLLLAGAVLSAVFLAGIFWAGLMSGEAAVATDFLHKNLPPTFQKPFGTDWLGRDMLARTLRGLSISLAIGLAASIVSALIALALGAAAALRGGRVDALVNWAVDTALGLPHLLLLILISFALGKGAFGVSVAVALSHWPSLARVIRGEILQLKQSPFILIAEKLGQSKFEIARKHMWPHVFPQFLAGLILLFPHAILHEAALTFLGFGLPPQQPGIGIILSESMKYLSLGYWWLALFPGLALLVTVMLFDHLGGGLRKLLDPNSAHE